MLKIVIPFYIICFGLYIFFSRQPDYQDGELTTGVIHYIKDSQQHLVPKAISSIDDIKDTINADYPLRNFKEGEPVKIIYETNNPSKAAVYYWWGYWMKWDELLASVLISAILLYVARSITANPTPEAIIDEIEMHSSAKRKKYK